MFRRKDEGLFDNDSNDSQDSGGQPASTSTQNSGASSNTGSSASNAPASSASAATASNSGMHASSAQGTSGGAMGNPSNPAPASTIRPASDARPAGAVPTASAFRPNAQPLPGDMTRNRMPEAKPSIPGAANAMAGNAADKGKGRRVLTVGNDILLKGEIATCDRLVIEGKVDATLNDVHTVEIAESGSFKGTASIEDAEISGLFEGDLVVRNRLVIYSTGKVRGKITYGEIEIERGGELMGEIKTTSGESSSQSRSSRSTHAKEDNKFAA